MKKTSVLCALGLVAGLFGAAPSQARAVGEEQFMVRTTADLAALCGTPKEDPLYMAAVNFCQGYAVGAVSLNAAVEKAARKRPLVCFPEPSPSRDAVVAEFIQWTEKNPAILPQPALQGLFDFLAGRFPCKR